MHVYEKLSLRIDELLILCLCGCLTGFAYISINAWIASSVFHSRDTKLTEHYDYFSANAMITYMFYSCLVRAFIIPLASNDTKASNRRASLVYIVAITSALGFFGMHIRQMIMKFDYGWNIKVEMPNYVNVQRVV